LIAVRLVYFARVREAVGFDGEERDVDGALTISELLDLLAIEDARHAVAFADRAKLRFALDQQMVGAGTILGDAKELAIFPPVTGG
jgi:sulfur-carrier protein